jgi:hypothetical protein
MEAEEPIGYILALGTPSLFRLVRMYAGFITHIHQTHHTGLVEQTEMYYAHYNSQDRLNKAPQLSL